MHHLKTNHNNRLRSNEEIKYWNNGLIQYQKIGKNFRVETQFYPDFQGQA